MKKRLSLLLSSAVVAVLMTGCAEDPVLPTAGFTIDPSEITEYDEVSFENTSTDADTYAWDFGDGSTSTETSPTHIYKSAGNFTVTLVATNADGEDESEQSLTVDEHVSSYILDGTSHVIESDLFWYSFMGSDPYIRLLTPVSGQDNPDLLKLYPLKGLGELPGTYTWETNQDTVDNVSTYDFGYTANYAGMAFDWTSIGKTGSGDLVITEVDPGIYKFEMEGILSVGNFNWTTGEFEESGTATFSLDYIGGITPL